MTVEELLSVPVLRNAQVVAGRLGLRNRQVRWTAVIEWPVEDFVRPQEFVLTTALGCDAGRFEQLVHEIANSGAAALCVSLHEAGELTSIPEAVVAFADEHQFPLITVPWNVRFAEIMMAATDRLIAQQYAAVHEEPERLIGSFTNAILGGSGMDPIAEALEQIVQRPVLIIGATLHLAASGRLASERLTAVIDNWDQYASTLSVEEAKRLCLALDNESPRRMRCLPGFGLPGGTVIAARARHRALAYLYIGADADLPIIPTLEDRAVKHAATAVAVEMLRLSAAAETEARVRGDFFWALATGVAGQRDAVAANAILLGYDPRARYVIAAGVATGEDEDSRSLCAEQLARDLLKDTDENIIATVQRDKLLVLLRSGDREALRTLLDHTLQCRTAGDRGSWGIAAEPVTLFDVERAYNDAVRALAIGAVIHGPGDIADAHALGPYLMLGGLARDPIALAAARSVLARVVDYDAATSRDLMSTLEVYLRENGNTSAAARALYLNRHSLIYRLRKIESLTGRSLDNYEDRFMLDLCVKLYRLVDRRDESVVDTDAAQHVTST